MIGENLIEFNKMMIKSIRIFKKWTVKNVQQKFNAKHWGIRIFPPYPKPRRKFWEHYHSVSKQCIEKRVAFSKSDEKRIQQQTQRKSNGEHVDFSDI